MKPCKTYRPDYRAMEGYERAHGKSVEQDGPPGDGICRCGYGRYAHEDEQEFQAYLRDYRQRTGIGA